jgi:hypothetical protein
VSQQHPSPSPCDSANLIGVDQHRPQRRPSAPTTENALGLTNITALATPDGMTASSYKSEHLPPQYAPPSDGTSSIGECVDAATQRGNPNCVCPAASGAQFGPFGTHAPAFQTPAADFGFYVQQQDQLPSQNTLMIPNLMQPGTDHLAHRPIYMLGGEYCSPSYVAYDNRMDSYPVAYTSYQHPSLPLFQHTPLTYNPTAMQQSRPVTSSSSGSPDEALMTPLLNNDPQHSDSHLLCVSTMPLESPFSTSPSTGGLAHGLEGMSCMPQAISGAFTSAQQSASMSSLRPPPLPRRNTDDLPFTDSPLSRSAPSRQKPYDVKSHSTQRPSSMDFQSSVHPTAVLSLDSNFLGKQRIACQGCRGKPYEIHLDSFWLIIVIPCLTEKKLK